MATGDVPSLDLTIDISHLPSASQLKSLLKNQVEPHFRFADEVVSHWNEPVEKLPAWVKLDFNLSQDASWQTSTGICFGLTGTAACHLEIVAAGGVIEYLDNLNATSKKGLPAEDYSGSVYVRLALDFSLTGNMHGSGNVGPLGISGNAKRTAGTSFVFAHKVKCGTLLKDAIAGSFASMVFPFEPSCAVQMACGDLAEVTFSGCMSYGLEFSYGLANYSFTAPSVSTALESCTKGVASLSLPSASLDIGASFRLGCMHSDDFTAIVQKLDNARAFLYLMRAQKTGASGSVGLTAQVTVDTTTKLTVDSNKLLDALNHVTQGQAGSKIPDLHAGLQVKLGDKTDDWINNVVQNGAGFSAAWAAQSGRTLILKYHVMLNNPAALDHSWDYFCVGDIRSAVGAGGLTLDPGSGISNDLSRSFTVGVTFFNFFQAQNVQSYFANSQTYVTDTGNIGFLFDVGEESDAKMDRVLEKARIHFVAAAEAKQPADVKLEIELSETDNRGDARDMMAIPGYLLPGPQSSAAANDMLQFVAAHPKGTLNLSCVLEPSAYGKLTCSPYNGNQPPADQSVDAKNWQVFHDATATLLHLDYAAGVAYTTWQRWNVASNDASGAAVADRRHCGDAAAGEAFWEGRPSDVQLKLNYFCLASSDFMNLCDDLQQLAQLLCTTRIPEDWNRLLDDLKGIVLRDVNTDFAKPAVASLLKLCSPQRVTYNKQQCGNSLTCTISLS